MIERQSQARKLREIIEKAIQLLGDTDALKCICLHEKWSPDGIEYPEGKKLQYNGDLYKVKQAHTSQESWSPDAAASLFEKVCESHIGTIDDPIPYSGNMILEKDKYYLEDGIIYLCVRDTEIAVFNKLSELVGIYVDVAA